MCSSSRPLSAARRFVAAKGVGQEARLAEHADRPAIVRGFQFLGQELLEAGHAPQLPAQGVVEREHLGHQPRPHGKGRLGAGEARLAGRARQHHFPVEAAQTKRRLRQAARQLVEQVDRGCR